MIRWVLLFLGAVSIAVAVIFDLDFVRANISADGHVEPNNAAALRIVRFALAAFGGCQIAAALMLDRITSIIQRVFGSPGRTRWIIFATPLLILGGIAIYKTAVGLNGRVYWILVQEDSIVEWATALAFLLSAGVSIHAVRLAYQKNQIVLAIYLLLISTLCLIVGLEEMSYGQRVVGFGTPEYLVSINKQKEANFHNIRSFGFIFFYLGPWCVGLFGMLGCGLPLLRPLIGTRLLVLLTLTVPPWFLSSWYVPYALFALYDRFFWGSLPLLEWQDSEVLEALLAVGFLGFVWHIRSRLRLVEAAEQEQPGATVPTTPR